jgi:hypothetical protein
VADEQAENRRQSGISSRKLAAKPRQSDVSSAMSLRGAQRRSNLVALRLASPGWRHIDDEMASLRAQ